MKIDKQEVKKMQGISKNSIASAGLLQHARGIKEEKFFVQPKCPEQ